MATTIEAPDMELPEAYRQGPKDVVDLLTILSQVHYGDDALIRDIGACLFSRGVIILKGVPGTNKSRLGEAIGKSIGGSYEFKQLHPEDNPSDLLGYERYLVGVREPEYVYGPMTNDVVVLDEVNRGRQATVHSLNQALMEGKVRLGQKTISLPDHQFVVMTLNPLREPGTRELGAAFMDRSTMLSNTRAPRDPAEMDKLLTAAFSFDVQAIQPVMSVEQLKRHQDNALKLAKGIHPKLKQYVSEVLTATAPDGHNAPDRVRKNIELGVSPRGGIKWIQAAAGAAYIKGASLLEERHLNETAVQCLRPRIKLNRAARMEVRKKHDGDETEFVDLLINEALASVGKPTIDYVD